MARRPPASADTTSLAPQASHSHHHPTTAPVQEVLAKLSWTAAGELSPMAAIFGGIVGQETMKAISGKFHPIHQFLYFDAVEALPASPPSPSELSGKVRAMAGQDSRLWLCTRRRAQLSTCRRWSLPPCEGPGRLRPGCI